MLITGFIFALKTQVVEFLRLASAPSVYRQGLVKYVENTMKRLPGVMISKQIL